MTVTEAQLAELREAVGRGVAFLDREAPGWRDRIDPSTLDMSDPFRCILGQVATDEFPPRPNWHVTEWVHRSGFARFAMAYDELGGNSDYGFATYGAKEYRALTDLWLAELAPVPSP